MQPISLSLFVPEFLALYETGKHARKTYLKMSQVLSELVALPDVATTADLTTKTMAAYVSSRGANANANTTNGMLDYLRACCSYAVEEGYLDRPPNWKRIKPRRSATVRNRACSYADVCRLLSRLSELATDWEGRRLHALVSFVVLTGVRRDEALYARVEDLDLAGRTFRVVERARRLKTEASADMVPMPEALIGILESWLPHAGSPWLFPGVRRKGPWTGGMPGRKPLDRLKSVAQELGISGLTLHGLRHTYGTNAVRYFKQPLWVVQRSMRHTDPRTTERYLHLDEVSLLVESVSGIDYRVPA